MATDGKKDANLTEICPGIPIINMVGMDTVAQRGQAEVESTATHLRVCTVKTH